MKWFHSDRAITPAPGDTRVRADVFLWLPKRMGNETRWLESATWLEEYVEEINCVELVNVAHRYWRAIKWLAPNGRALVGDWDGSHSPWGGLPVKWNSGYGPENPKIGDTRVCVAFLWWPRQIGGETRWLERAWWVGEFASHLIYYGSCIGRRSEWHPVKWATPCGRSATGAEGL